MIRYILSGEVAGHPVQLNQVRHGELVAVLEDRDRNYTEVRGYYEGRAEESVIVTGGSLNELLDIADEFDQETILLIEEDNEAQLVSVDTGTMERLGVWTAVDAKEAWGNDHTYDPTLRQYYKVL